MYAGAAMRPERPELKCKNRCEYFGNPQWDGYCSKCYREQRQKQQGAAATSPIESNWVVVSTSFGAAGKSDARDKSTSTPTPIFSKFEEKRQRQTDSLKKTKFKFKVFRKNTEEIEKESAVSAEEIPHRVYKGFVRDVTRRVRDLGEGAERDLRYFLECMIRDVLRCAHGSPDLLSERIQYLYQMLMKRMESLPHYSHVDADTREVLIDVVEEHAMTFLYDRVLSWSDEREEAADRSLQARMRQLAWVMPAHLDCRIDRATKRRRQLLYDATDELLGMDTQMSPGGKLSSVRRCCACVVELVSDCVGAPASADDLLPALIFTLLKANPPRLVSNINYVTRFSNANRLMTGEKGYYFTNLCCAVSFIEKLSAESLGMDADEFECYMKMPLCIGGSSWTAALGACERSRRGAAQRTAVGELTARATSVQEQADKLTLSSQTFYQEIEKKADILLERTPLQVKPRVPPRGLRYLIPFPPHPTDEQDSESKPPSDNDYETIYPKQSAVSDEAVQEPQLELIQPLVDDDNINAIETDVSQKEINKSGVTSRSLTEILEESPTESLQPLVDVEYENMSESRSFETDTDGSDVALLPEKHIDNTASPELFDEVDRAFTRLEQPLPRLEQPSTSSRELLANEKRPVQEELVKNTSGTREKNLHQDLFEPMQEPPPLADVNYDLDLSDMSDTAPNILDDSPQSANLLPPPLLPESAK